MILAVQIFQIIFYSVGILFMLTLGIIGVWGFVIINKAHKTQRVQNYLLDKIYQSITDLTHHHYKNTSSTDIALDDSLDIDEVFDLNDAPSKDSDSDIINF